MIERVQIPVGVSENELTANGRNFVILPPVISSRNMQKEEAKKEEAFKASSGIRIKFDHKEHGQILILGSMANNDP